MPGETEWLEFKEAKASFNSDELGKYFSALSNEANLKGKQEGWLIFGVTDSLPRSIVGTRYRINQTGLDSLKQEIAQQTNGFTFQEIHVLSTSDGRVVMFQIPPAPRGIPVSCKGHYYGRNGESLAALSLDELETIREQVSDHDWSAEVCDDATVYDLDEDALAVAQEKFRLKNLKTRFGQSVSQWDTTTFLDKAKLTINGAITRTAILLLGKPESAHFLSPHPAQITWKLDSDEQSYEHFGPPFFLSVEEVFRRIRNISFRIQPFSSLIPVELTKYDSKIILEALNNCIAHQDYAQNSRVIVVERTDRLIMSNAGGFYDGTVEDYVLHDRTPERYRNPFLTQAMVSLDMIDTVGSGIRRMFVEQMRRFFPLPEYDLGDRNHVQITIYGKLIDENYSRILMENQDLALSDAIQLDRVQKKQTIEKQTAASLRKRKLIEGRYPNLFVSAGIAQTTGNQVEYTKHRAFNNKYYVDLVLQFLIQHGKACPEDIQVLLADKFSDLLDDAQRRNKVRNLLQKMARGKMIQNNGTRGRNACWVLMR
jgi:ATP-dependent DNA helicase RecG